MHDHTWTLRSGDLTLVCSNAPERPPHVMGILNVTPDSFYDGGRYLSTDQAVKRVADMISEGATIIDIGGASSRPRGSVYGSGADVVPSTAEMDRVIPVIAEVADRFPSVWISVDTYLPDVAREALAHGAHIINDITGLRLHPELANVAAASGAPMILMHSVGRPGELLHAAEHDDVIESVYRSVSDSVALARERGLYQIVIDPGFGFGKTVTDNLRLINKLDRFHSLDLPVLVGISRKSSIGSALSAGDEPVPVEERLFGTLGATAVAALRGASIIRTHDVRQTVELLKVLSVTLES